MSLPGENSFVNKRRKATREGRLKFLSGDSELAVLEHDFTAELISSPDSSINFSKHGVDLQKVDTCSVPATDT